MGTPRLWLLTSEGIGPRPPNCQPLLPGATPDGSALALVSVSLDGRKSYVGGPFGSLAGILQHGAQLVELIG